VDWAIALVMFCGALNLDTSHLLNQLRNWRLTLLSFGLMFGLAPLIVLLFSWPLRLAAGELPAQLYVGLMILAAQSCTLASGS